MNTPPEPISLEDSSYRISELERAVVSLKHEINLLRTLSRLEQKKLKALAASSREQVI